MYPTARRAECTRPSSTGPDCTQVVATAAPAAFKDGPSHAPTMSAKARRHAEVPRPLVRSVHVRSPCTRAVERQRHAPVSSHGCAWVGTDRRTFGFESLEACSSGRYLLSVVDHNFICSPAHLRSSSECTFIMRVKACFKREGRAVESMVCSHAPVAQLVVVPSLLRVGDGDVWLVGLCPSRRENRLKPLHVCRAAERSSRQLDARARATRSDRSIARARRVLRRRLRRRRVRHHALGEFDGADEILMGKQPTEPP